MQMLDDIVDGALDDTVNLWTILRKCLVVADKLNNATLQKWIPPAGAGSDLAGL